MNDVKRFLEGTAEKILPRILTQISRDPGTPFHGACDRNWWHYKIRDFPSIILQQAGYALSVAADLPFASSTGGKLRELAAASARFWNQRAILHGAFEEYYPYEQGYPPAAFSTLAVAKLCQQGIVPLADVRPGLVIAARQLLTRFEAEAANQQIAGTAALSIIRSLDPSLVTEPEFQRILSKTLALQHPEGWFPEYDGPDLGYLSVSIDCLWDIFDQTHDPRVRQAITTAADYTAWFILSPPGAAGMHNSRNTDYFVPYGLVRLALEEAPSSGRTSAVVHRIFSRQHAGSFHPFDAVDDRYWSHYIGHSVFRALLLLEKADVPSQSPLEHNTPLPSRQPGSGHVLLKSAGGACALVSTRKGSIATAVWPDGTCANDFGWIVESPGKLFVSHWWSNDWTVGSTHESTTCEGYLVAHQEFISSPGKHIILRIGSFILGRRLIRSLKRLVIFKKPQRTFFFSRRVSFEGDALVILDQITGVSDADLITRAPRSSKRHVASADSFHPQDFEMARGSEKSETIRRGDGLFECETRYVKALS